MSIGMNQPHGQRDFWQAVKDLEFLSAFFSWFFLLLTRLSEPLMLLSTLYVVAEAGVPVIAVAGLHHLAVGIMITAPEVILPGSFVVASRAQAQGERRAGLLLTVCWLFVGLTLLTLISLFVWHFTGTPLDWLMCARCAAAVGYCILMRMVSHSQHHRQQVSAPDVIARLDEFSAVLHRMETTTERHMHTLSESVQRFTALHQQQLLQLHDRMQHVETGFQACLNESLAPLAATLQRHSESLSLLPTFHEHLGRIEEVAHSQLRTVSEEVTQVKASLERIGTPLAPAQHHLAATPRQTRVKPLLQLTPSKPEGSSAGEFDKAQFVFGCLGEDPEMKIADIQQRAAKLGQTISVGCVSQHRKTFLERMRKVGSVKMGESDAPVETEAVAVNQS